MAKLIYSGIMSLDGYIADRAGKFDWSVPDEEVHTVINDLTRSVGTFLLGRRMYEVLVAWESLDVADQPLVTKDFAEIWRTTDKVVYSTTLATASSARTRIETVFHPEAVRRMKAASERDISVGGPNLAAHAIKAGLVDEYHLFVNPVTVDGGTPYLPHDTRVDLELLNERRFSNGVVFLRYRGR
ncbi:MAG: dihydrofolate reductase family protein [Vicinamibacteraceae bacterium]